MTHSVLEQVHQNRYRVQMNRFEQFIVACVIMLELNSTLARYNTIQYFLLAILALCLLTRSHRGKILVDRYSAVAIMFLLVIAVSCIWSINMSASFSVILFVAKYTLILYFMSRRRAILRFYLLTYCAISVINALLIIVNTDLTAFFTRGARLDTVIGGVEWGTNLAAPALMYAAFFFIVIAVERNQLVVRLFCFACVIPLVYCGLLLGSRQSIVILFILLCYFLFKQESIPKWILIVVGIVILIVCLYQVVMSNETLALTIGARFSGLLNLFTDSADSSDAGRLKLIENGLGWFLERPVLGHGADTYRTLNGLMTGRFGYSHNNYIDLLVGNGLLGLCVYYSIFFKIIRMRNRLKRKYRKQAAFSFALILSVFFSGTVIITYTTFVYQFMVWLSFYILNTCSEDMECLHKDGITDKLLNLNI